jgi:hypothetical protein
MKLASNPIRKDNHYTDVVPRKVLSVWIRSALSHPALSYGVWNSNLFFDAVLTSRTLFCVFLLLLEYLAAPYRVVTVVPLLEQLKDCSLSAIVSQPIQTHITLNFALIFASHTSSSKPQQKRTQEHLCSLDYVITPLLS